MENLVKSNLWIETGTFLIAAKNWIAQIWLLLILKLRLRMAIKLADMKHFITDKRYFVYPDTKTGGLFILNNDEITLKKKQKIISRNQKYLEIRDRCFYATATKRYGHDAPNREEKIEMRRRYIRWQKTLKPVLNKAKVGIPLIKRKQSVYKRK
ncbi:MAG: hypothetical protein LBR26_09860 [Prevotella sp.]|nr:hypothetical protein [Prevotella sp.]